MSGLSCGEVRGRLTPHHDGELPLPDLIAIQSHIARCRPCRTEARGLARLGGALRAAAAARARRTGDLAGLEAGVISRLQAEREEAFPARMRRKFDDMRLVAWAGLGATAATLASGLLVVGLLWGASIERGQSLQSLFGLMASPGSNANPVALDASIHAPRVARDGVMPAVLVQSVSERDLVLALAAVVTREGQVTDLEVLTASGPDDRLAVVNLLNAVSVARFEPARFGGSPVAVNLVWLLAHTTVRGTIQAS